jgi:hypothetical protein
LDARAGLTGAAGWRCSVVRRLSISSLLVISTPPSARA